MNDAVSAIAASAVEQATGLAEVNRAVSQMDQVTQQNAAMVEQSTAASHTLATETAELVRLADHFQVGRATNPPPPARKPKRPPAPSNVQALRPKAAATAPERNLTQLQPATKDEGWEEF